MKSIKGKVESSKDEKVRIFFALVAQWIEQKFPKLLAGGSIPLEGTG